MRKQSLKTQRERLHRIALQKILVGISGKRNGVYNPNAAIFLDESEK
jgi:hypothetical protein